MRYLLLSLSAALLVTLTTAAQTNGSTNKNKGELQKSIKELGNLFKKKKTDSAAVATSGATGSPATASKISAGLKPGTVLPNAKVLDADQLAVFNGGAAVIRKGNASALIDTAGNFIVPYNQYDIMGSNVAFNGYNMLMNGMFKCNSKSKNEWGYLNAQGKQIVIGILNNETENKRLLEMGNTGKFIYVTPDGRQYTPGERLYDIVDGIGITYTRAGNSGETLKGFKKLSGEKVTGPLFDEAYHFSDGMACVGKKTEYGEMKYGFINMQGKLVIPFTFSIRPSDFSGGFAKVQPKDKSEFEYAFIDKAGNIVLKQTRNDIGKYGTFNHFTNYGLAFSGKYIMDTTFKIISHKDFFTALGIPADSWFVQAENFMENERNPKLVYSTRGLISPANQMPLIGFINLATRKVIAPTFDFYNVPGLYFDPVAHLAYAQMPLGKDARGALVYRSGYINEDGLFVMVKGEGNKW